ncbi:MAG: DUF4199 domain-containing protein [Bacteroidales bacterium]|nr:DUF4199 domain-containing protein [Bacteroidales bacterium]
METKKLSASKFSLGYGLIIGALLIILSLVLNMFGMKQAQNYNWISYVIILAGIIWGSLVYRNSYSEGLITYGQSFSVGFLIGLYAAILSTIFSFIYLSYINPGSINEILEITRENLYDQELSDDQIEQAMNFTEKMTTPIIMSGIVLIWNTICAVVFALIVSIFVKKEQ